MRENGIALPDYGNDQGIGGEMSILKYFSDNGGGRIQFYLENRDISGKLRRPADASFQSVPVGGDCVLHRKLA